MRLRAGVVSDCGLVRSANEDSFLLRPGLYAVCDGMGGARAGEVASQMACLGLLGIDPSSAGAEELRTAIAGANKAIVQRSASEGDLLGMGTTLTTALLREDSLLLGHVGDSRAYLLHGDELTQITDDHSWVGEMLRRGDITAAEAASHPHRSVITRALGTDLYVAPDLAELPLAVGDRVLLCSDGLTGMVDDEAIGEIMRHEADPQAAAQALVDAALESGGEDNVTVVVVDVEADETKDEEKNGSWMDTRILIGPGDRESAVSASSHPSRRAGASVRERLGRRGGAIPRPGSRITIGREQTKPDEASGGPADATEPGETAGTGGPEQVEDGHGAVIPPPAGKTRRGRPKAGSGQRPWWQRRWLYALVALLLVLAIAVGGLAWYNSSVYYVGKTNDGKVALYRGLPWELWGIEFSRIVGERGSYDDLLLESDQQLVDQRDLVGKEEGKRILYGLRFKQ
jgi:serine/threonine protein phosphatase PrpC